MKNKGWFAPWGICFILCGVGLVISAGVQASESAERRGQFKILTYNIWGLYPIAGGKAQWRYPQISKRLEGYDIVGIQEAWDTETRVLIRENHQAEKYPYLAQAPKIHQLMGGNGLLILSRFEILDTDFLKYKSCIGSDCLARKGVLFARLRLDDGSTVDVYNTHLNAWFPSVLKQGASVRVRRRQIAQLTDFILSKSSGRRFIVLGDFNTHPGSLNYQQVIESLNVQDLYREAYPDPRAVSKKLYSGHTYYQGWNTWVPSIPVPVMKPKRIDFIFGSSGLHPWEVAAAKVEFTDRVPHEGEGQHLSDHFGVSATIAYQ